jgi:hypothetical protein
MLFVLGGCSSGAYIKSAGLPQPEAIDIDTDVPRYPVLGEFKLDQNTPTIDSLLAAFSNNGKYGFMARGLRYNYIEIYPGRAWCDMSFKSGLVVYLFGVQLVQASNGNVVAVVRNMRTAENYPVDHKVLEVNPIVYAALLDAQRYAASVPTVASP